MKQSEFSAIQIGLASPEKILEWSHGEVKKPETINYRSQKSERDGLFCERIFGPTKDWECFCGKYKKVRYKGVVCDRCGVEITKSDVRRERMGHIELAAPVAHIWYLKSSSSKMSILLDIPPKTLEEVIYFQSWVVTDPKDTALAEKQILSENEYRQHKLDLGFDSFEAGTGAEAVRTLLENVDLEKEKKIVIAELETARTDKRRRLIRRLETIDAFINSDNQPEWMILSVLPVIPPDLRPMLQLDGGRFATSDMNDLYRRVITRNNRLRRLLDMGTPAIIVQNEKRMLQESVDALIDNGRRSKAVTGAGNRALKSLSHSLKGKHGRFRQNLLGKRVDYSGRSVIVVGPDLKMHQAGIPREMAIKLFEPHVVNELVISEQAYNQKVAEKMVKENDPLIWDALERVIVGHPVMLNRAPTLHRLGIQAFMPKLVEGKAIQLHPLVTPAFNADFDGDQMAVHLPLSEHARAEAEVLMLGSKNILGPKDGKPIVTPSQDMVLGNYYLNMENTKEEFYEKAQSYEDLGLINEAEMFRAFGDNEGKVFSSQNEVLMAYESKLVHLHTRIAVRASSLQKTGFTEEQNEKLLITTVGKLIFNDVFPKDFPYLITASAENLVATPDKYFVDKNTDIKEFIKGLEIHEDFVKGSLSTVISEIFKRVEMEDLAPILDDLKDLGFKYSTVAGITVALSDVSTTADKGKQVEEGKHKAEELRELHRRGVLTTREWERHLTRLWDGIKDEIGNKLVSDLPRANPINMMVLSGARGNVGQLTQLSGMRGLMAKPTQSNRGDQHSISIIEVPIYSSFMEGLNVSEFFISTHGVRKGLTDTALKTAESGYLTRRLVDVAQDVIVTEEDCGTDNAYMVEALVDRKENTIIEEFGDRIVGRFSNETVVDPNTGEVIVDKNEFLNEQIVEKIVAAGIEQIGIRNTFTCESMHGVCMKCYGRNMATGKIVEVGESVGIMAAQSIGEPGTQLTMRTFHAGGVAGGSDITQGLPRVEELFEARIPKSAAVLARIDGVITAFEDHPRGGQVVTIANDVETIDHRIGVTQTLRGWWEVGSEITAGDKLTEGQVSPKELLEISSVEDVQKYILKEVQKVYGSQGIGVNDKHIEVIVSQMLRKVVIIEPGDTGLSAGVQLSLPNITKINLDLLMSGKIPATFKPSLLGITKASVETDSFLSAASFQETTRVLTDAAVAGKVDDLFGLKENVILGKMIPAGTGSKADRVTTTKINELAEKLREERIARNFVEEESTELPLEMLTVQK